MKKNYIFLLFAIPVALITLFSFSGGVTNGQYTGSPGDGFNTCTTCHTPGADFGAVVQITSDIPAAGFEYGVTYEITVSVSSSAPKHGFQVTAEDAANMKVGTFTPGSNNQLANGGTHLTHIDDGMPDNSWTFNWTAPETVEGNEVTFYTAVNATNDNGNTSGDQVRTASMTYTLNDLDVVENNLLEMSIYPNPTIDIVNVNIDDYQDAQIQISDLTGKIVLEQKLNSSSVDVSHLSTGMYLLKVQSGNLNAEAKLLKK